MGELGTSGWPNGFIVQLAVSWACIWLEKYEGHSATSPALSQRARNKLVACHWRHLRIIGLSPHSLMGSTRIDHPQGTWNLIYILSLSWRGQEHPSWNTHSLQFHKLFFGVYRKPCRILRSVHWKSKLCKINWCRYLSYPILSLAATRSWFICTASLTCEKPAHSKINSLNINIISTVCISMDQYRQENQQNQQESSLGMASNSSKRCKNEFQVASNPFFYMCLRHVFKLSIKPNTLNTIHQTSNKVHAASRSCSLLKSANLISLEGIRRSISTWYHLTAWSSSA